MSKLLRPRSIRHTVARYRLLPAGAVPIAASLLAPLEVAAGALLLAPWSPWHRFAQPLAIGLLLVFSLAIASALARGLDIPCACGPALNSHAITHATLWRNLALVGLLLLADPPSWP